MKADLTFCMKVCALLFVAVLAISGCGKKEEPAPAPQTAAAGQRQGNNAGSGDGIRPLVPSTGPLTPVVGGDNLQGGGSGSGQVMKDKARNLAAQSPSSLNQGGQNESDSGNEDSGN